MGGEQLQRSAGLAAQVIMGQSRPDFTPGYHMGDQLVVINIKDVVLVAEDWIRIPVEWQTKYPSGQTRIRSTDLYDRDPCMLFWMHVREAIEKHHSARHMVEGVLEKLHVFEDAIHPHVDKCPRPIIWQDPNVKAHKFQHKYHRTSWRPHAGLI